MPPKFPSHCAPPARKTPTSRLADRQRNALAFPQPRWNSSVNLINPPARRQPGIVDPQGMPSSDTSGWINASARIGRRVSPASTAGDVRPSPVAKITRSSPWYRIRAAYQRIVRRAVNRRACRIGASPPTPGRRWLRWQDRNIQVVADPPLWRDLCVSPSTSNGSCALIWSPTLTAAAAPCTVYRQARIAQHGRHSAHHADQPARSYGLRLIG